MCYDEKTVIFFLWLRAESLMLFYGYATLPLSKTRCLHWHYQVNLAIDAREIPDRMHGEILRKRLVLRV
jgi:hypothetical protein